MKINRGVGSLKQARTVVLEILRAATGLSESKLRQNPHFQAIAHLSRAPGSQVEITFSINGLAVMYRRGRDSHLLAILVNDQINPEVALRLLRLEETYPLGEGERFADFEFDLSGGKLLLNDEPRLLLVVT